MFSVGSGPLSFPQKGGLVPLVAEPPEVVTEWLKFLLLVAGVVTAILIPIMLWGRKQFDKAVERVIDANGGETVGMDRDTKKILEQILAEVSKTGLPSELEPKTTLRSDIMRLADKQEAIEAELAKMAQRDTDTLTFMIAISHRPILLVNGDVGMVVIANQAAERFFGWPPGQLTHVNLDMLIPERFRKAHDRYRGAYMQAPTPRVMTYDHAFRALRRDGTEVQCHISLYPLEHSDGLVLTWIAEESYYDEMEAKDAQSGDRSS